MSTDGDKPLPLSWDDLERMAPKPIVIPSTIPAPPPEPEPPAGGGAE